MDEAFQLALAKSSLCETVEVAAVAKDALSLPLPDTRYDLLLMAGRMILDISQLDGFHLLADNDTARELRELIY